jgi:hypothetical protein
VRRSEFWPDIRIQISETGYVELDGIVLEGSLLNILDSRKKWTVLPSGQQQMLVALMETALQDCGFIGTKGELDVKVIIDSNIMWMMDILPAGEASFE